MNKKTTSCISRLFCCLSVIALFLTTPLFSNAQLLQWNTFGNAGTETTEPSVFNDANIAGPVNLTNGGGWTPAANANRYGGSAWFNTGNTVAGSTLAEAIAGNDYIQFVVTPNAGIVFTPTSLVFTWDRSGTGPANVTLRSSVDGFATDLGTVTGMVSGGAATTTPRTITISTLSNLSIATTFRLYAYGATATGGTGGFDNATSVVDVQLNGSAMACAPTLTINTITNTCTGTTNGAIDLNVAGGISPFIYAWSNGATTEDITGLAVGTYAVTVTSTGGCSSTISATVAAIALPTVNFSGLTSTICINSTAVTLTGNQAPAGTFTGTGITDNGNGTATFNPATAGLGGPYNVTYNYSNGTCSNLQTQQVSVVASPDIQPIASVSNTCPTATFDLSTIALVNNGASGSASYFSTLSDANTNSNAISSTVSSSGTYYIRVTTGSGCFDVEPVSVSIISCSCDNPPSANAGGGFSICANANAQLNGSIGGSATSATWSGGAGTFIPNATTLNAIYTPSAGEISAGTVTLTLTTDDPDGAGPCVASANNVTIIINALPNITTNPVSTTICNGSSTANITASGASTYAWSPNDGTLSATTGAIVTAHPSVNTVYTVTGTDANGCVNSTTLSVTVNQLPITVVTPNTVSICNGATSGVVTASGATTYTWANAGGLSATTGATVTANPTSATTYTVTGTDGNSCSSTATLQVNVNALPVVTISGSTIICGGSPTVLDAGAGYTIYLWSSGETTQTISKSTAGTYTVTVTNANGCSASASKTLTVSTPPVLSATATASTCNTSVPGTIDLTATGGTPCNANAKGLLISKISANPNGTDSPFEFVELIATKDIDFSITPYTVIFANNGTATANGWVAGGALTYAFQINTGTAVAGGVYYVGGDQLPSLTNRLRVINTGTTGGDGGIGALNTGGVLGNGGTADGVAVFNLPVASLTSSTVPIDAMFYGSSIGAAAIAGGTQGYQLPINDKYAGGKLLSSSFAFGDFYTTVDRIASATGTYDAQSNTFTTARTFANNSLLSFVAGTSGITLTNTVAYTYNWSNGATTQDVGGLAAGNYTVTVTDCNGCSSTISKTIVNVAPPVVSFSGLTSSICVNASPITLTGSNAPSGSFTGIGITDNGNGTASFNPTTATVGGPYSITYSYTSPTTGCTGTSSQSITVTGLPDIQPISGISNNCPATTVDIAAITIVNTGVAGTPSYFATLTDANNNVNSISSIVNTSGTYYVRITTANGCYDVEPVIVTISGCGCNNPATASAGSNFSICANADAQLNGSIGGGASSATWSGGAGTFIPNANTLNAAYTPTSSEITAGTVTLTLTTNDPDGSDPCVPATSSVTITINAQPTISVLPISTTICEGSSTGNIIASGGISYSWSNALGLNHTTGSTVIANPIATTYYTVTGADGNGCTNTATVEVLVNPKPPVSVLPSNPTICLGNSVNLSVTGASTYTWANAGGLSSTTGSTVTANPITTSVYTVTGTDGLGCTATATTAVNVNPLPVVTISGSTVLCLGSSTTLNANAGFAAYLWNTGESTQSISTAISGNYTVTVTDNNGCTNSKNHSISSANLPVISSISSGTTCFGSTSSILITTTGGTPCPVNTPGLLISKVSANPAGTDSPFEFVELIATRDINFAVTPYSVIFANNGSATSSGWKAGGAITYGFEITTGTAVAGGVYYVGGNSMQPLSNHLREINTATNSGDGGLGTANLNGVLGNGGTTTDGVAIFNGTIASVTASTEPVDALLFGTGANPVVSLGAQGYQLPVNDNYAGGKVQTTSFSGPEPVSGEIINATGTYNAITNTFTVPRTYVNSNTFTEGVSGVTVITAEPYSYNWSNSATTQNLINISAGTYTVTVTDCNGCTKTASSQVTVIPMPKPYLSVGDTSLCSNSTGFTIQIKDSGYYAGGYPAGTTFWFIGSTPGFDQYDTLFVQGGGLYLAQVKLPASLGFCTTETGTSIVDFSNSQAPQISFNTDSVKCKGGSSGKVSVQITFGGTPNFHYHWFSTDGNGNWTSISQTTKASLADTISNLPKGWYVCVVTDNQGNTSGPNCAVTDSVYLDEPAEPVSATESHVNNVCNGGASGSISITPSGGTPGYQYLWSNSTTAKDATGLVSGTYTCTVTDSRGCSTQITATITQPVPLAVFGTVTNVTCKGNSSGAIVLSFNSGGNGTKTFIWSNGATTQNINNLVAGIYKVTVSDNCGQVVAQFTVTQPATGILLTTMQTSAKCYGSATGTATVTASGGTGTYVYSWNTSPVKTTAAISGMMAGTYTCTVSDNTGCTRTAVAIITQPAALLLITSSTPANGGANGTATVTASGGTTPYTYLWNTVPGKTTATITGLTSGVYTVTVKDKNGCSKSATVVVAAAKVGNASKQLPAELEVNIWPNPTDGIFNLKMISAEACSANIKLMDVTGRVLLMDYLTLTTGENNKLINAAYLPKGVYILGISTSDKSKTIRIVIQ